MGTDVIVSGATPLERVAVEALFERWDGTFSRFRGESELNHVNSTAEPYVRVTPLFARVLGTAIAAAARTDGLVDPTLGVSIEAAGYDRDFSELLEDTRPLDPAAAGSWRSLRLAGTLLLRLPGTKLDLNGVVKAMAVESALELIAGDGFVAAGGDVAARGSVVVGLPGGAALALRDGGVATSGTTRRRWRRGGSQQHHLLDPRTGRPSRSRWHEVTVAAPRCLDADVAAKAAFLLADDGPEWLDDRGLAGRFLSGEEVVENACWRAAMDAGAVAA
jgi:thiamine biosynthesis lipoprotein